MSEPEDKPFVPVTRADVTDLELLPRRFEQFAEEMRTTLTLLVERFLPAVERLGAELADVRVTQRQQADELAEVRTRLAVLEAAQVPPPRVRAKRPPLKKKR